MEKLLPIDGTSYKLNKDALVVRFKERVKILSSAVLNGGLRETSAIVNLHVDRDFYCADPVGFMKKAVQSLVLPENTVGLMTAVDVRNLAISTKAIGKLKVSALVTAGISYPATAGDKAIAELSPGTINAILLVDGNLTDSCMVNSIATIAQAKAVALRRLDIRSRFPSMAATGTTTDALALACTGRGDEIHYAGLATNLGIAIGDTVAKAVENAIGKQEKLTRSRPLIKRLEERKITIDDLVKAGLEIWIPSPEIKSPRIIKNLLRQGLLSNLGDANVSSLVIGAMKLQEEGELGLIPGLSVEDFLSDSVALLADESIGIAISDYIGGTRGVHNFHYYDRKKPGILKKLGPFLDDAMAGLIAGTMSQIFSSRTSRGHQ
ncbi:MAG: bifunctional adenosylcobinamide hydrolase/alpha-ribazole phosphatase CbiS [Thaumarchaeota archaeon]|nr:bifunctional adenosylcobinamide hydrolase/alpha-ribazole phosphatase CbiS [Nitrososphaerota archaeon]